MKRFFAAAKTVAMQAYNRLFPHSLSRHNLWPVFIVFVIIVAGIGFGVVHADIIESVGGFIIHALAGLVLEIAKLLILLTIFFLRFFITLASYNNYIDVSVVQLGWVMVRDVANIFFIVGLLVIAFATILGFESYEWKKGVMKIVLMAILINFSNLIAQLVIDIAHIFTITFLNAISATAGGNLISMFQMDKVLSLVTGGLTNLPSDAVGAQLSLFGGAVFAFLFALTAAVSLGAYVVVMAFRIVVLWALIILSPIAFMLYAMPKGEKYAQEWWSEFSKHVIVAPVMVFFLWLAFATLGTGQIISEIQKDPSVVKLQQDQQQPQSISILEVSTWENMASFILAVAFLSVGLKKTQETGAQGAGMVASAAQFGKTVAAYATGEWLGRKLAGASISGAKGYLGTKGKLISGALGLERVPIFGSQSAGKLRDAAALEKQKKRLGERARRITAQGGGFAGLFAPNAKTMAREKVAADMAEKEKKTKGDKAEIDVRSEISLKQRNTFDQNLEGVLMEKYQKRRQGEIAKITDPADRKKAADKLKEEVGSIQGFENREDRLEQLRKKFSTGDLRKLEEEAAVMKTGIPFMKKGTPLVSATIREARVKDETKRLQGQEDKFFGVINLGHVMKENGEFDDASKKAIDKLVKNSTLQIAATKRAAQEMGLTFDQLEQILKTGDPRAVQAIKEIEKHKKESDSVARTEVAQNMGVTVEELEEIIETGDPRAAQAIRDINDQAGFYEIENKTNAAKDMGVSVAELEKILNTADPRAAQAIKQIEKYKDVPDSAAKTAVARDMGVSVEELEQILKTGDPLVVQAIKEQTKNLGSLSEIVAKTNAANDMGVTVHELQELLTSGDPLAAQAIKEQIEKEQANTNELGVNRVGEAERVNAIEDVIKENPQWLKVQAHFATEAAAQKVKKGESEDKVLALKIADELRGLQGKRADEIRNMERSKISEELKEFAGHTFDELFVAFSRNWKTIKNLTDKQNRGETLTDQEGDYLKNARQDQARVVASAESQGYHGAMLRVLKGLDTSYQGVNDEGADAGRLLLGALSGRSYDEIEDDDGFVEIQEEYRKGLKEKAGILMRTVQKGVQDSAELKGNAHLFGQVREGVDERGVKVVGLATGMKSNVGRGKQLGTGRAEAGSAAVEEDMKMNTLPAFDIFKSADGSAYMNVGARDTTGRSTSTVKAHAKGKIAAYARARGADAFKKEGRTKLRWLLGAEGYDEELWDKTHGSRFKLVNKDLADEWKPVFAEWKKTIEDPSSGGAVKTNTITGWKELFVQWGADPVEVSKWNETKLYEVARDSGLLVHP